MTGLNYLKNLNRHRKIIILVMLCKDKFFIDEFKILHEIFNKVKDQYPYIKFYGYCGNCKDNYIDIKNDIICLKCPDDINSTFKKTSQAFKFCKKYFKYDYIFRTNTSTVINLDLLQEFTNSIKDDNILYTSELYKNCSLSLLKAMKLKPCENYFRYDIYGRGNGLLLSKKLVNVIISADDSKYTVDDFSIGCIMNMYFRKNNMLWFNNIRNFPHAWFKSSYRSHYGNPWCTWGNEDYHFSFIKNFITIQVKSYDRVKRITEFDKIKKLCNEFMENKDNSINRTVDDIKYKYIPFGYIFENCNIGYFYINFI